MTARDVAFTGAILFIFGIGFFVLNYMMSEAVDDLTANPVINSSNHSVTAFEQINTNVTSRFDYLAFALFIGLVLGIIITAYFIGGHPIFVFIYITIVTISTVLATILNDVWSDVTQSSIFGTTITNFPITNHILGNLEIYIPIIGFLGIIAMFAKQRE